jgi:tyrosyl-tRNA synthetase
VHGEEGLQQALRTTEALRPGSSTQLDAAILEEIAGNAPSASLPAAEVAGQQLADVAVAAKLLPSKGEFKRMVKNGGVYLNNAKVSDPNYALQGGDLIEGRLMLLAAGKKNKMLVRVQQ